MPVVIDASYTLAMALDDEAAPGHADIVERIAREGAIVSPVWKFELANVLLHSARRGRISMEHVTTILARLSAMAISIDGDAAAMAWTATLTLAQRHGLTHYDASYLEIAVRRGAVLATMDRALARAARKDDLSVVGV